MKLYNIISQFQNHGASNLLLNRPAVKQIEPKVFLADTFFKCKFSIIIKKIIIFFTNFNIFKLIFNASPAFLLISSSLAPKNKIFYHKNASCTIV